MTPSWAHNLKLIRSLYDTNRDQLQADCETPIVRNVISKCKPNMLLFSLHFFPYHFAVLLKLKKVVLKIFGQESTFTGVYF